MKKISIYISLLISTITYSQSIVLDNSFGINGIFEMPFDSNGQDISNSILLPNGKILMNSTRINGANEAEVFLCRINSNGSIDTSFGVNGYVFPNITGQYEISVRIQSDEKILIYGGHYPAKIIKYEKDGLLDSSFGLNGIVELSADSFPSESSISFSNKNILLLDDDTIILRCIENSNTHLRKFLSDGTIDSSFGVNGLVSNSISKEIFISIDSKIIGFSFTPTNYTIEKLNLNGTFDNTFGTNGIMTVNLPFTDFETKYIEQDNSGRFLVEKLNFNSIPAFFFDAFRLNSNGIVDNSFGANGFINFNNFQTLIVPTVLVGDKYYFGGTTIVSNDADKLIMMKYNENGTLDTNFNNLGYKIEDSNSIREICESINIQTDGKIIVSGQYDNGLVKKLFLKRYTDQTLSNSGFNKKTFKIINPVTENLTIITNEIINKVILFGTDGKVVLENNQKIINTSKLSKGLYIGIIDFQNDENKYSFKIMKE